MDRITPSKPRIKYSTCSRKEPGPSPAAATTSPARLHVTKSPARCAPGPWPLDSSSCRLAGPRHEVLLYRCLAFLNWDALDDKVIAADTSTPRTWTSSCSSPRTQQLDIVICSRNNITCSPCSTLAIPRVQHLEVPSLRQLQLDDYSSFGINTDSEFLSAKEGTCAQNISRMQIISCHGMQIIKHNQT
jgi:hypothetical protein